MPREMVEKKKKKKIFKNNHNKNSHPVKGRKRALAGAGSVCSSEEEGRSIPMQQREAPQDRTATLTLQREGREKGGKRRCFVPAFQAETLGLKMVFSRADRTGELSVHTSLSVCLTEQTNAFNMELYTSNHRDTCS